MRILFILSLWVCLEANAGALVKATRRVLLASTCALGIWVIWPQPKPDIDPNGRVTEVKPPDNTEASISFPLFPPRAAGPLDFRLVTKEQPQQTIFSWADPNLSDAEAEFRRVALKEASRRHGLPLGRDGIAIPPISFISEPSISDEGVTVRLKIGELPYEGAVTVDRARFERGWTYSVKFPDYEHHDKQEAFSLFAHDIFVAFHYDSAEGNLIVDNFTATLTASFVVITRKTLTDKVNYTSVVAPHPHRLTK